MSARGDAVHMSSGVVVCFQLLQHPLDHPLLTACLLRVRLRVRYERDPQGYEVARVFHEGEVLKRKGV